MGCSCGNNSGSRRIVATPRKRGVRPVSTRVVNRSSNTANKSKSIRRVLERY